ncbi:unnamed protein product [Boreogadus saida]
MGGSLPSPLLPRGQTGHHSVALPSGPTAAHCDVSWVNVGRDAIGPPEQENGKCSVVAFLLASNPLYASPS